ncbi:MAG: hypothetical protein E6H81_06815 [Chloroflexi bacterium]|nr:MAG: hypothetical protein E6H81_06815 [Chloroflexota bacterium]
MEKRGVRAPSISDVFAVPRAVWRARRALDRGDLGGARELVGPLLETYGGVTFIRKLAAEVLYASADPLSAASFFEQVAKKRPDDRAVVVGLVASYAALDRAGDARRSAARLPEDVDVRLALAWAELVAKGGDPARGEAIVAALASDGELQRSRERIGMHRALAAIVAARQSDNGALRGRLREAEGELRRVRAPDRAFLAYLCGIALRTKAVEEARTMFGLAIEASPDSVGAALARRERARLS